MIGVLRAGKGDSFLGVRINGDVDWNETMRSLDRAGFPHNQLLDYLPAATAPWTYTAREWDPSWNSECVFYNETMLLNLTASGNGSFIQPLDAFPAYKATFNSTWLDTSRFRMQSHFNGETVFSDEHGLIYKDALFWTVIQSAPMIDDRMYTNNETLHLSISALHTKNIGTAPEDDFTQASSDTWRPLGVAENASFSRTQCIITRKPAISDDTVIPWLWTNDTYSVAFAYKTYWMTILGKNSAKNLLVTAPTPYEMFRFYQAYIFSVNSWLSHPSSQYVSVRMPTVQLSTILLAVLIILAVLIAVATVRYCWFLRRHKQDLEKTGVPDGRLEWMIHAARLAAQEEEQAIQQKIKDRDYLRSSSFGKVTEPLNHPFKLARVHTSRKSLQSDCSPSLNNNRLESYNALLQQPNPSKNVRRYTESAVSTTQSEPVETRGRSLSGIDIQVLDDDGITRLSPRIDDDASPTDGGLLKTNISWDASTTRSRTVSSRASSPGSSPHAVHGEAGQAKLEIPAENVNSGPSTDMQLSGSNLRAP